MPSTVKHHRGALGQKESPANWQKAGPSGLTADTRSVPSWLAFGEMQVPVRRQQQIATQFHQGPPAYAAQGLQREDADVVPDHSDASSLGLDAAKHKPD